MNCPHCNQPIPDELLIAEGASIMGKKGRNRRSPAQAEASRKAGLRPVKPGSRPRGRPRANPDDFNPT